VAELVFDVLSLSSANTSCVGTWGRQARRRTYRSYRVKDFFGNSEVRLPLPLRHEFSNLVP
jgi:hypothetical protein